MLKLGMHSVKGGVGRTTAACMLGLRFAQEGLKVLLVDTDFEAPTLDMVLRVHPELFGKRSESGIDHLLQAYGKQRIQDEKLLDNVQDVGEKWKQPDWMKRVRSTLPSGSDNNIEVLIERLVSSDGAIIPVGAGKMPGRLYMLPCSRDGETNLRLNYGQKKTATSLDQGLSEYISRIAQAKAIDIVLVDMRNGTSDAAALAGQTCDGFVTVLLFKYIQVFLLRSALYWYLKTQKWYDRPTFSLFTSVPDVKDSQHEAVLLNLLATAYTWKDVRSEWLQNPGVRLLAGKLPSSPSLKSGDFFLSTFDGAERNTIDQTVAILRQQAALLCEDFPTFRILVDEEDSSNGASASAKG